MAIEIVDFPIKHCDFSIVFCMFTRGYPVSPMRQPTLAHSFSIFGLPSAVLAVALHRYSSYARIYSPMNMSDMSPTTWWLIPLSKWVITPVISGSTLLIPFITGVTSSTAQGGGGSFKNRKPIGEVGCCESGMAKRIH